MPKFGGNTFTHFSVPLVYDGRYFLLEPGEPPLLTVFVLTGGKPEFEVLKNKPVGAPSADPVGVTVKIALKGPANAESRPTSKGPANAEPRPTSKTAK